jgi:hypothetical protein
MKRTIPALFLLLALSATAAFGQVVTSIAGDSIAKADTCSTTGPSDYLAPANNLAIDGNVIYHVTALIHHLPPGRAWVHVGINDVMLSNRQAEKDLAQMLNTMSHRKDIFFVVDTLGQMAPISLSPAREAVRLRMNAQLLAFNAANVFVLPYNIDPATETCDWVHPNNLGYAKHMPLVLTTFALSGH